jgi:hypothetical protein
VIAVGSFVAVHARGPLAGFVEVSTRPSIATQRRTEGHERLVRLAVWANGLCTPTGTGGDQVIAEAEDDQRASTKLDESNTRRRATSLLM